MPVIFSVIHFLAIASGPKPAPPIGTVNAVYSLIDRVLPKARSHFSLSIDSTHCKAGVSCYHIKDSTDGTIAIAASGANELAAGLGFYFRQHCNMTIGWERGGGSNIFLPKKWPRVGGGITGSRNTPMS